MSSDEIISRKLQCIFCHASVFFPSLPPNKYTAHLQNQHDIHYEMDRVIETTLVEQFPSLASSLVASLIKPKEPLDTGTIQRLQQYYDSEICGDSTKSSLEHEKSTTDLVDEEFFSENDDDNLLDKYIIEEKKNPIVKLKDISIKPGPKSKTVTSLEREERSSSADSFTSRASTPQNVSVKNNTRKNDENHNIIDTSSNSWRSEFSSWKLGSCVYRCKICSKGPSFESHSDLSFHVQNSHKITSQDYHKAFGASYIQANFITCIICNSRIRHDNEFMYEHIFKKHNIALEEYYETYVYEGSKQDLNEQGESDDLRDPLSTDPSKPEETERVTNPLVPDIRIKIEALERSLEYPKSITCESEDLKSLKYRWDCGMLYGCKLCPKQYFDVNTFKRHLKKSHEMEYQPYVDDHGDSVLASNVYECLICGRGMTHTPAVIRGHIEQVHQGITMAEYYDEYKDEIDQDIPVLPITDPTLVGLKPSGMKPSIRGSEVGLKKNNSTEGEQWFSMCTYECKMCDPPSQYKSLTKVRHHIQGVHKSSRTEHSKNYGSLLKEVVLHTCQLCWALVRWSYEGIGLHLSKYHEMNKDEYYSKYMSDYSDWPMTVKLEQQEDESDDAIDKSRFECKACDVDDGTEMKSYNGLQMLHHVIVEHRLTILDYIESHGSLISGENVLYHECAVCHKRLLHSRACIETHIAVSHSMDVSSYMDKLSGTNISSRPNRITMSQITNREPMDDWRNQCTFQCRICFKTFRQRSGMKSHVKGNHGMTFCYLEEHFGSTILEKRTLFCQLCKKKDEIIFDSYYLSKHFQVFHKNEKISDYKYNHFDRYKQSKDSFASEELKWSNQCEFNCSICFTKFHSKEHMQSHLRNEHNGMEIRKYKDAYGIPDFSKRYHVCQFEDCKKEMVWEENILVRHLNQHSITLEVYMKKFKDSYQMMNDELRLKSMNMCTYICKICAITFDVELELIRHVMKEHEIKIFAKEHGRSVARKILHTCMVCDSNLLWDKRYLQEHLNEKHSLALIDYINQKLPYYQENETSTSEHMNRSNWMIKCEFQCISCEKLFQSKSTLKSHAQTAHKEVKDRTTLVRLIKEVSHICQVCGVTVQWDSIPLYGHMKKRHNLHTDIYHIKYMSSYTEDSELIRSRQAKRKQWKQTKKIGFERNVSGKIGSKEGSEASENSDDYEVEDEGLEEDVKKWATGCLYYCQRCDQEYAGMRTFASHLAITHKATFQQEVAKYQIRNVIIIKGLHYCRLCNNNVHQDVKELKKHFKEHHDMTIKDYYDQFKEQLKVPRLRRPPNFKPGSNTEEVIKMTETVKPPVKNELVQGDQLFERLLKRKIDETKLTTMQALLPKRPTFSRPKAA